MPRLFAISRKLLLPALFLAIAGAGLSLRADPPNPLRPSELTSGTVRIIPLPVNPPVVAKRLADDEPESEVPSIVENRLTQPELIPAPSASAAEMGDYFTPPDLGDPAPWQHMVHPLFAEPWFSHGDP